MKTSLLPFAIAVLVSCTQKNNRADSISTLSDSLASAADQKEANLWTLENYLAHESPDTTSVQLVTSTCAVLIYPTDDQIDELTRENGDEDFSTIADDSNYYQSVAIDLLDSAGINTVTASRHYVRFIGKHNSWLLNVRKKGGVAWGIILFNKTKSPEIVSAIDLSKEYIGRYFDKTP